MTVSTFLIIAGTSLMLLITAEYLLRHHHKWQPSAVDQGVMSEPRRNATAILYVCTSCGQVKSTVVAGTYKLEDVRSPICHATQPKQNDVAHVQWSASDEFFTRSLKVKL